MQHLYVFIILLKAMTSTHKALSTEILTVAPNENVDYLKFRRLKTGLIGLKASGFVKTTLLENIYNYEFYFEI